MPNFSRLQIDQGDLTIDHGKVYAETGGFKGPLEGNVTGLVNNAGLHKISETFALADFTDNEDATGTAEFSVDIPVGAYVICCICTALTGFTSAASTSTAVVTVGDGTDPDRYMTGTPSVIADADSGITLGEPSGIKYHSAAKTPTVIITEDSDFTQLESGSITLEIYYLT